MKKAISIWSFTGQPLRKCMELAKDAGFDGIELAMDGTGELTPDITDAALKRILKDSRETGIRIHSIASGLYWDYSFTSDEETQRERAVELALRQIRIAKTLEADSVLIVPGAVGVDFLPGRAVVPYDIAYERALLALRRLAPAAVEAQIQVGIENVWNKFLVSPLEMRDFIDQVDCPYIGSYFDVGNVVYNGYPEQWIRILGKRIKKVHFKDYRRAAGGLHGFVDLLAGDVDWPEVMRAFRDIGYDGYCTAEMLPPYTCWPEQILYNTAASMDRIFGKE